jgi:hypothetical protein
VPAPEIKEICRLHNKIYTGYDYFDQRTTTIYSGTAYWWLNGDMDRISQQIQTIKITGQSVFYEKKRIRAFCYVFEHLTSSKFL